MNSLQKMGGVAALVEAATFVVGFALLFTLLVPLVTLPRTSILYRTRLSSRTTRPSCTCGT
jgi:hypothetical protein